MARKAETIWEVSKPPVETRDFEDKPTGRFGIQFYALRADGKLLGRYVIKHGKTGATVHDYGWVLNRTWARAQEVLGNDGLFRHFVDKEHCDIVKQPTGMPEHSVRRTRRPAGHRKSW